MLTQIGVFLVDVVASFFVFMLLARFHFQWLRVSFRNPVGEFVLATTNWIVMPARRLVPGLAGLDLATLVAPGVDRRGRAGLRHDRCRGARRSPAL